MSFEYNTLRRVQDLRHVWTAWGNEHLNTLGILDAGDFFIQLEFVKTQGSFDVVGCLTKFGFGYMFLHNNRKN